MPKVFPMTNQELQSLFADVDAEESAERAQVEALLLPYRDAADASTLYSKSAQTYGATIKRWLEMHPDETLTDGEHGLTARLQSRRLPGQRWDLLAIRENNPALYHQLEMLGCLSVDAKAVAAHIDDLAGLKRYELPAGETSALIVVRR